MADDTGTAPMDENPSMDVAHDEGPPPRLMITKMQLENFKSYAGTKEIGPFHKCFSSIVGPNGSGKSNVIDAMLFVFGKRAKKLRLNKVSELIHSSDAVKHEPPQFARVSVFFQEIIDTGDGDQDYDVVPDSQHVVTRLARRDNSSQYKLNQKTCAFKDIAHFLNSKGIDLDNNRFLILQGEVEMISMMPPKGKTENDEGLLEYLEDIIGSNQFVEDANVAALKVDQLTEQRQEKLNRVKAVEKEKDNLESAKVEAEALLHKEREIRRKKNVLCQIHAMRATEDIDRLDSTKRTVVEELNEERERLAAADQRVKQIDGGLTEQRREYDKIHAALKRTKEEFAAYERKDIKLREEIKHAKTQKKKLEQKVKTETKKEATAIETGKEAEASIPALEERLQEITEHKAVQDEQLEQIFEDMKGVTDKLRIELEEKSNELAPVKQERAVYQAALDTATTEVKLLEDSTTRAKDKLAAAEKEYASLDETQASKREELSLCEDELAASKARIIEAEKEERELAQKEGALAKRNKELMALAEESKAALQARGGARSQAVAGILQAARKGGELAKVGILGRLGDLATISEEYDVAVSTACGMLDHVVVQTTAGAQRCLEFLRKHGLGRANFVPLDKMKKGAHDRAVETPEGAPRLFELISPANFSITPVIYLAVGNTLVAPDLETATRWAYDFSKRWRVVTLDGKLIETSGTMAGGGKNVRKGGMRLANARSAAAMAAAASVDESSLNDCKKLEEQANEALGLLQACKKRRRELSDEIRALKKRVKTLSVKLPKLTMEIEGCDTTREELSKRIPELQAQSELSTEDAERLEELNSNVAKCKSDMASCAMQASKLEGAVAKLQKAILDAGGPKLKKQQAACDKAESELGEVSNVLNAAKVAITSSQKAVTKARDAKAAAEEDLNKCKATMEEKQTEFKALEEDALQVMQAYEEVKEVETQKRKELEEVSRECEQLKKSQAEIKVVEIELLGQVEGFDKQIADSQKRIAHYEEELDNLRAAELEDDDYDVSDDEEEEPEPKEKSVDADGDEDMGESTHDKEQDAQTKTSAAKERSSSLPVLPFASLKQYGVDDVKNDISVLEAEQHTLAKNANMGAISEYRKKEADYLSRVSELDEVTEERNAARKEHEDLRRKRLEKFMDGFGRITLKLKEMYQMITLGGDAELELVDSLDPFSEGIVFSVRPPKKSWKNIANLSGGEKTLSSLALVFALHHYKPTPLYVMDEIDAALDFKNVSIVANYIKERTKNAQFIIISLRNNMFELADRLVGIYKTNNCTKSVTINPRAFSMVDDSAPLGDKTNATGSSLEKERIVPSSAATENSMVVS